jgi:glutamine synthetase
MSDAGSGVISLDQLKQLVATGEIDTVISAVCDMQGRLIGKRVTGSFFIEHCLDHGTHFCTYLLGTDMEMNTPDGFEFMNWESGYGDFLAQADWNTLRVIPWLEKTAMVLSDAVIESTGELVSVAPRTVLRKQIERLKAAGFSAMMAAELEFYVLSDSYDQAHAKGYVDLKRFGWYNEDYQLFQATKAEPLYRKFRNYMTAAGVPIEFSKGEAAPGQHEVNIHYSDALESADRAALLKHGCKEIAYQDGLAVTFMAKPDHDWTGSSGHIHVSLWDDNANKNLFFDAETPGGMSQTMRWFLGGMIATGREFALLLGLNVNSYKRFASASWAPTNIVWSRDNRTCGYRIVGSGNALRIENRFPGGDANPYLAYAAVLAAGLYGIENQIDPGPEFKGNGYLAKGFPRVPRALYEAIEAWEESGIARDAFGADVAAHYLNAARVEQETYDRVVTSWERERYFERG